MLNRLGFFAGVLLVSASAHAHFKLLEPAEWLTTDAFGNPQKTGPCGSATGPESGAVTTVVAGSTLKLRWTETIGHPGHYRIAITPDRSRLVDPVPVLQSNNCVSAPIEAQPAAPVLMDGLFQHTNAAFGMSYEQSITVPSTPCENCTLQVLEFMSSHAPPCFYYHCATLRIVAADGGPVLEDGGAGAGDAGSTTHDGGAVKAAAPATGCAAAGGTPGLEALLLCAALRALGRLRSKC